MRSILMASMAALCFAAIGCERGDRGAREQQQTEPTGVGGGPTTSEEVQKDSGVFDPSTIEQGTAPSAAPEGHATSSDPTGGEAAAHGGKTADKPTSGQAAHDAATQSEGP